MTRIQGSVRSGGLAALCRVGVLALLVLACTATAARAQPGPGRGIQGTWYCMGDRALPCYIDVAPDGSVVFTNEWGDQSAGRVVGDGRVVATKWRLIGQVQGGVIRWGNRSYWTR